MLCKYTSTNFLHMFQYKYMQANNQGYLPVKSHQN